MAGHKVDKAAGVVVRRLRDRAGVTQEALADEIGLSYQQLQKYETGQNRISISRLFDIAEALDTKPNVIVKLIESEIQAKKEF